MGKTKWQDKNVGVSLRKGRAQRKLKRSEEDGSLAGYEVEHWDDHQDAVAMPKPIELKLDVNKEE